MITLKETYDVVTNAMKMLENIDMYEVSSTNQRILNQQQLNKVYRKLDDFKAKIIREDIKNKQKKRESTNDRYKNT